MECSILYLKSSLLGNLWKAQKIFLSIEYNLHWLVPKRFNIQNMYRKRNSTQYICICPLWKIVLFVIWVPKAEMRIGTWQSSSWLFLSIHWAQGPQGKYENAGHLRTSNLMKNLRKVIKVGNRMGFTYRWSNSTMIHS